ncbi:MAG: hypothetical protein RL215_1842 [Planctomycetota bacterium]
MMKTTYSVRLAVLAACVLAGSHSAQAQQHVYAVNGVECQQCPDGQACNNPGCCLCRVRLYPDAGWNPPVNMPVNYDWAWYGLAGPQAPYGAPNGGFVAQYPSVYQPTDTTQLGYYYHKVPTWQPQPGRIPGVPCPEQFHSRTCPANCYGGCWHGHLLHAGHAPANVATSPVFTASAESTVGRELNVGSASTKSIRSVSSTPEPELKQNSAEAGTATESEVVAPKPAKRSPSAAVPAARTVSAPSGKPAPAKAVGSPVRKSQAKPASGSGWKLNSLFD